MLLSLAGKNKSIRSAQLSPVYTHSTFPVTSIKTKHGFSRLPVSPLKQEGGELNAYKQILWSDKRWHLLLTDLLPAKVCECSVVQHQLYNSTADLLRGLSSLWIFCKSYFFCLTAPGSIRRSCFFLNLKVAECCRRGYFSKKLFGVFFSTGPVNLLWCLYSLLCTCSILCYRGHEAWQAERGITVSITPEWLACGKTKLEWFILAVQILVQLSQYCFGSNQKRQSSL